jgi:phosphoglycerate kinase
VVGDFNKKTIKDVKLDGATVLVRSDFNVPIKDGHIENDFRIQKSLPTLRYLIKKDCKVVICSHLGRPKNAKDKSVSLKPVAKRLEDLLGREVWFSADCVGEKSRQLIKDLPRGGVLLLENLRFHEGEKSNDSQFAKQLTEGIDWFVQDGFGAVHRQHASTVAVTEYLKSVSGLLLADEINTISEVMEKPDRPLFALIGGAKISDKIDMLKRLIEIADGVAVGGAMANTFLLAQGIKIGKSIAEPEAIPIAKEIIAAARAKSRRERFIFYIPQDGVVAKQIDNSKPTRIVDWGTNAIAEIENYPKHPPKQSSEVADDELILDIGPFSGAFIAGNMQLSSTVIWNGAMGVAETPGLLTKEGPYSQGTELVVEAMLGQFGHKPKSLIGGGDTVGYIESQNLTSSFDHVSTGGGASMQLMSGKKLPGVEALQNRDK